MTAKKKVTKKTGVKPAEKPAHKTAVKAAAKKPARVEQKTSSTPSAATADAILGRAAHSGKAGQPKINPKWAKYYNILIDLRDRLRQQIEGLAEDSAQEIPSYSLHMADSGTDNFDRDFALSLLSSDQDAIYEIEEAIKRIERNTYGICELTGKPIPKARLDAIPWTRFTVEAQAQLEREGNWRARRLGDLGTVDTSAVVEVEETETEEEEKPIKEKE